jgi:hypothetical protein
MRKVSETRSASSASSADNLTEEQLQRVRELKRKGYSEWAARGEVLAKDHPVGCDCEVCL